jgi:branched-chain amino acid transport system permease protein
VGLGLRIGWATLDLGYVAFFAVGAYTTATVTSLAAPAINPEMAFFQALPWVLVMAAIAGLIIGTPVIRMRGDYLAIVTLGFGEIIRIALLSDWLSPVTGGAQGILRIAHFPGAEQRDGSSWTGCRARCGRVGRPCDRDAQVEDHAESRPARRPHFPTADTPEHNLGLVFGGASGDSRFRLFPTFSTWTIIGINPPDMFRIILVFVAIAAFVSWRLRDSRVGRAWMAVREDEQIAQSMGINIVTTKLLAFVMGAMLASLGGALFAVKLGTIFPHSFEIIQSIIILVVVIVGGMGSIKGVPSARSCSSDPRRPDPDPASSVSSASSSSSSTA